MQDYHKSVLTAEMLTYLAPRPGGLYVDVTFGGGGHSRAILEAEPNCRVIGLDWDQTALEMNAPALKQDFGERFIELWGNFAQLPHVLNKIDIEQVDGILADFGTSQYQLLSQEGFSFARTTPLDMRMSPSHQRHTAADIVNKAREEELEHIFRAYGEERFARQIARALVEARGEKLIFTTKQLADVVASVVHRRPGQKIHPATKVFQALRIAVNHELDNIKALLKNSMGVLVPGGRMVCISFHSLEDRIVKNFFRENQHAYSVLTRRVVKPSDEEVAVNPSSRSAVLRAAERTSFGI